MLFSIVAAQISLVEYDALSCVVVAIATSFPGLVSCESGIKSSSFFPPLPTIDFESIAKFFNSYTTQHLRFTTPSNWPSPYNLPFLLLPFSCR